jgi:hypothetical protein
VTLFDWRARQIEPATAAPQPRKPPAAAIAPTSSKMTGAYASNENHHGKIGQGR